MSRGKQLKTKIKEAVMQAALVSEAIEISKAKALQKIADKKPLGQSVKEHLGKILDKIDPLEMAAVIGATMLIKSGIDWSQETIDKNPHLGIFLVNPFSGLIVQTLDQFSTTKMQFDKMPQNEIFEWIISFVCAYLIVHNFGKIVEVAGKLVGDVVGMSKGLLGIMAVA